MAPSPSCFITFKNSGLSWSAVPRIVLTYPWIANRVIMSALGVSAASPVGSPRADTDRIHGIESRWRNWREFRRMLDRPDHPPAIYCQDISKNLVSPSAFEIMFNRLSRRVGAPAPQTYLGQTDFVFSEKSGTVPRPRNLILTLG